MTSSTTTVFPDEGTRKIQSSQWEALMLNSLLLPSLSALFLVAVVAVTAFVLIKRKARTPGNCPERSCHTVESFNEESDISNHCVACANEGTPEMDGEIPDQRSLTSWRKQGWMSDCGTKEMPPSKPVFLKHPALRPDGVTDHVVDNCLCGGLLPRLGSEVSPHNSLKFEGRVYETLEKHRNRPCSDGRNGENPSSEPKEHCLPVSATPDGCFVKAYVNKDQERIDMADKASSERQVPSQSGSAMVSHVSHLPKHDDSIKNIQECRANFSKAFHTCAKKYANGLQQCTALCDTRNDTQMVCRLSFFPISNTTAPQSTRDVYYVIQNNDDAKFSSCIENYFPLSPTNSIHLQFSPQPTDDRKSSHDKPETIPSLNLKPLVDTSLVGVLENESKPLSRKTESSKGGKKVTCRFEMTKGKQLTRSSSYKKCNLKKSESFSETASWKPNESMRKFSLGSISFNPHAKASTSENRYYCDNLDKAEVARITSKLGPLPPVPPSLNQEGTPAPPPASTNPTNVSPPDRNEHPYKGHNSESGTDDTDESSHNYCGRNLDRDKVRDDDIQYVPGTPCSVTADYVPYEFENVGQSETFADNSFSEGREITHESKRTDDIANHYFILDPSYSSLPLHEGYLKGHDELGSVCGESSTNLRTEANRSRIF